MTAQTYRIAHTTMANGIGAIFAKSFATREAAEDAAIAMGDLCEDAFVVIDIEQEAAFAAFDFLRAA